MIRLVRMRNTLLATIHKEKFHLLDLNNCARPSIIDIEDKIFWKSLYSILCAIYLDFFFHGYCNSNTLAMDKIFFLSHCTSNSIVQSMAVLNKTILFGPLSASDGLGLEETEVYGVEMEWQRG